MFFDLFSVRVFNRVDSV